MSSNEKAELAAYNLKDVAQTWYTQWSDKRALRLVPISWEVFMRALFDRFFPREKDRKNLKCSSTFVKEV